MARIHQFSHSCFVLGRERERYDAWQKSAEIAPVVAKRHWKYWEREKDGLPFRDASPPEDDSAARLEYFQIEDGQPRDRGPDGYSKIVFAPYGTSLRTIDVWRTFSHRAPAALSPTAAFFQSSKTVTLTREGRIKDAEKTFMHLFCATLFRRVYVQEIISRQGHVMKGKPSNSVHVIRHVY